MRYIILSVNANADYYWFTPLVCWSWQKIGWTPVVFIQGDIPEFVLTETIEQAPETLFVNLKDQEGYRSDTITQMSRLYAGCLGFINDNDTIMTGDIDMLALSDYWNPITTGITVYGHDLTGYGHYPLCYVSATKKQWRAFMYITSSDFDEHIKRDLDTLPQAKEEDFYQRWFTDQDLVTERIKACNIPVGFINRGQRPNGYAAGRVDRGSWTLDIAELIDCHMHRDIFKAYWVNHADRDTFLKKWMDTLRLLEKVWPNESFEWLKRYTAMFSIIHEGK